MPLAVACLVPAAPALLPRLTGDRVPELAPVRAAVATALEALAGLDRVVVVATRVPGTVAGFGAPGRHAVLPRPDATDGTHGTDRVRRTSQPPPVGSWPHALAAELLDAAAAAPDRRWLTWDDVHPADPTDPTDPADPADPTDPTDPTETVASNDGAVRTGLLLLADGSRTRGPRAPGGEDPRGDAVDAELVAALREARAPVVPDAPAVGATAGPAVELLAALAARRAWALELLHADAPLGVGYLVAVATGPAT